MMFHEEYQVRCLCCGKWAREHPWFEGVPVKHSGWRDSDRRCFKAHMDLMCRRKWDGRVEPQTRWKRVLP